MILTTGSLPVGLSYKGVVYYKYSTLMNKQILGNKDATHDEVMSHILNEIDKRAKKIGADLVLDLKISYEYNGGSMLVFTNYYALGTAVIQNPVGNL